MGKELNLLVMYDYSSSMTTKNIERATAVTADVISAATKAGFSVYIALYNASPVAVYRTRGSLMLPSSGRGGTQTGTSTIVSASIIYARWGVVPNALLIITDGGWEDLTISKGLVCNELRSVWTYDLASRAESLAFSPQSKGYRDPDRGKLTAPGSQKHYLEINHLQQVASKMPGCPAIIVNVASGAQSYTPTVQHGTEETISAVSASNNNTLRVDYHGSRAQLQACKLAGPRAVFPCRFSQFVPGILTDYSETVT